MMDLSGVRLFLNEPRSFEFILKIEQLRFQVRWNQTPRIPETTVLGHCFFVAIITLLLCRSGKNEMCDFRVVNNYFCALFHDLPEAVTRDIISPVKTATDGLPNIVKKIEDRIVANELLPLMESYFSNDLMYYTSDEFSNRILDSSGKVRHVTYEELNEKYKESVGKINSGYEAKLNEMNQKNGEKMVQFLKNIEANEDGVKKSIDELKAKNEQRLLEINKSVEETDSTLLAHLSDLEGKYNEVYGRLDSKVNEIYDDHENKYMAKIELFSKDYDARFEELAQKYSAATESLSDQISAVERLYSQKEGGINSEITQKIEELGKVYNERIENLKKSLADSFSEAKERTDLLSNATVESNGKIAALEVDLDEKMQFVRQKYTGLFEDALRKAQKEEDEAYEKLSAEARNNIEKFSSSMDSKISELKGELDGTLAVISGSLKSAIDETEGRVSRIEAKCDLSMEKISLVEPELNEKIRSISEEMQKFREEANNKIIQINGMLDDSSEKIRRACDEHEIEALKDVDLKVRTINSNIEKFQVVAENKISALSESIKSSTEKLQGFVEDTAKNIKPTPMPAANSIAAQEKSRNCGREWSGPSRIFPDCDSPMNNTNTTIIVAVKM